MCRLCETRKLVDRVDRVLRSIKEGSPVNTANLPDLLNALRNDLVAYHNDAAFRAEAMAAVAGIVAEVEAAATGKSAEPEEGATHCNPGTIQ